MPKYGIKTILLFPEKYVEPHNYESIVKDFKMQLDWAAYHLVTLSHEMNFKKVYCQNLKKPYQMKFLKRP